MIPLTDTVIVDLKEVKDMLCNTVKEMPMTLDKRRGKAENDAFIKKMKMQMRLKKENKNTKSISTFSICDDVLLYTDRVVMLRVLQKKILKDFYFEYPGISRMKRWMQNYTYWHGMDEDIERVVKTC